MSEAAKRLNVLGVALEIPARSLVRVRKSAPPRSGAVSLPVPAAIKDPGDRQDRLAEPKVREMRLPGY